MPEINLFRHARDIEQHGAGAVLFREGEAGDEMFAVLDGSVDLVRGDGRLIETSTAGGIVGEMALVDAAPRSATAVVPSAATVARISRREFTYLVQEHPTFALQVMGVLADRLRRANDG